MWTCASLSKKVRSTDCNSLLTFYFISFYHEYCQRHRTPCAGRAWGRAALAPRAVLPQQRYGKVGIYVLSDYGLCSSPHHAAHLSVPKQAPAVTTSHSGKTQAEVHSPRTCCPSRRRRLSVVPSCPLSPWGERDDSDSPPHLKGSAGGKRRLQPLATFPQCGRKRVGPRPGRGA